MLKIDYSDNSQTFLKGRDLKFAFIYGIVGYGSRIISSFHFLKRVQDKLELSYENTA